MAEQPASVMRQLPLSFLSVYPSIDSEVQATTSPKYRGCQRLGKCPKVLAGKYHRAAASVEKNGISVSKMWHFTFRSLSGN